MDKEKMGNFILCSVVIVTIMILSSMRMDVREKLSFIPSADSVLASSDTREIKLDTKDLGDLKVEHVSYGTGRMRIAVYDTKHIFPDMPEDINIYTGSEKREYSFFKNTIYGKEYLNFVITDVAEDEKLEIEFRGKTVKEI